ncbi:hypothetical protein ACFOWA_19540 [Pedobacter lithocola]|uniref:DUF4374 domain-containing protein n=1 Tax=Pedobacter lithocola TaxID=1908239 RepID=A0ABV8PH62_9SPHI
MKTKNYLLIAISATLLFIQACKKEKEPENTSIANYALSVTGGVYPSQKTYLFGANQFPTGNIGTSTALESESSGMMFKYGKFVYQTTFLAPATLRKFEFGADGKPVEKGSFAVAGFRTFGGVDFISETEAYASANSYGAVPKLIKFNPTTMQILQTIDLSSIQKPGTTEVYYQGFIHRGNYLYFGVNYQKNFASLEDKVFIAIVDLTTGKLFKLISDDRSSQMWNGGSEASFSPNFMIKDSSGDIYAMGYANNGKPSGVLRIKNNETEFDPTYFFNLNTATGKPCLGLFNFPNGLTFTLAYSPTSYPFDSDANYDPLATAEYHKINLTTKTSSGNISSSLPKFFGNAAFMTKWNNEKIYFNVAAGNSNNIYSYLISNGTVSKEFTLSAGACNGFAKLD